MKRRIKWIDKFSDTDLQEMGKEYRGKLIKPGSTVRDAVIRKIDQVEKKRKGSVLPFRGPFVFGYGIAALFILVLGAGFFTHFFGMGSRTFVTMTSGSPVYSSKDIQSPLSAGVKINKEYIIETDESSVLHFQDNKFALFRLEKNSRFHVNNLSRINTSFLLDKGEILAKTYHEQGKKDYKVLTANAVVSFGSVVFIRYSEGETYVALKSGNAVVESAAGKKSLAPGQSVIVESDGRFVFNPLPEELIDVFKELESIEKLPALNRQVAVTITMEQENVTLIIDDNVVSEINRQSSFLLSPGDHNIRLEKDGFESYHRLLNPGPEGKIFLTVDLEKKDPIKKQWNSRTIYTYVNQENQEESGILGFAVSEEYAAAVTRNSLLCFRTDGSLLWEKVYGRERKIFFDSVPFIYNRDLYLSANDNLFIITIPEGRETVIATSGMVGDGFHISLYNDLLYFPLPDGIYTLNPLKKQIDTSARYSSVGPVSPLITENGLFIPSILSPDIVYMSHDGKTRRVFSMNASALCTPIMLKDVLIAADKAGTLYRLGTDLTLLDSLNLENSVSALVPASGGEFFILTADGMMLLMDSENFRISQEMQVDNSPVPVIYFYKKPVIIGNDLFIGTDDGTMLIVNASTGQVRDALEVKAAVSCSVYKAGNVLFTGTENGSIIQFE